MSLVLSRSRSQFYLYYGEDNSTADPINVAYVAPSVTPYTNLNPSYRVYEYNRTDGTILNYQQYYTDLELTSTLSLGREFSVSSRSLSFAVAQRVHLCPDQQGYPTWTKAYDPISEYGMSSLSPAQWSSVITRFNTTDTYFQRWRFHHYSQSPGRSPCTGECKSDSLCAMRSSTAKAFLECTGEEYNLANLWEWLMNHLC
jgi:sphingomyelin phosphodiesterase